MSVAELDRYFRGANEEDKEFVKRYMKMNEVQRACFRKFGEIVLGEKQLNLGFVRDFNHAFMDPARFLTIEYFKKFLKVTPENSDVYPEKL